MILVKDSLDSPRGAVVIHMEPTIILKLVASSAGYSEVHPVLLIL